MVHGDVVENLDTLHGRETLRESFAAVPAPEFAVERSTASTRGAIGQWRLPSAVESDPFRDTEPTGEPLDLRSIDVLESEDRSTAGGSGEGGRLAHDTVYDDGLTFARRVGLLPEGDSLPDRALAVQRGHRDADGAV